MPCLAYVPPAFPSNRTVAMPVKHHCNVWLRQDGSYWLPQECYAIVRLSLDNRAESYKPTHVDLCSDKDVVFRKMQTERYYENLRMIPTFVVCKVSEWIGEPEYDSLMHTDCKRTWKQMIAWSSVCHAIYKEVKRQWPIKLAGYDGPFTPG